MENINGVTVDRMEITLKLDRCRHMQARTRNLDVIIILYETVKSENK